MRARYLNILELNDDASDQEIKSAYRRLSKQYHPDHNTSIDAQEKFISIKEAYEYLSRNGNNRTENISYQDDGLTDQERWRRDYRQWAREKEKQHYQNQQELIKKINSYFRSFALRVLVFNLVLGIDFFLPYNETSQKILSVSRLYETGGGSMRSGGRRVYRYDEVVFEDYVMKFDRGDVVLKDLAENALVRSTMILDEPMYAVLEIDGQLHELPQIYSVYFLFGYLIPVMLGLCILFFRLQTPLYVLNTSIVILVFTSIQLFVFFFT